MKAELLMIGTELLLGQIRDTNAAFLGQVLAANGIGLYQKVTVGDNPERIKTALDTALKRCDVVLCSGGLGPTEDDITRECIAELLGLPMEYQEPLFEHIRQRFAQRNLTLTENNKKQAMVPRGAQPIPNPNGTAPGLIVDSPRGIIICMPGVPHELEPMMTEQVIPFLRQRFGMAGVVHYRVLKVYGIGESRVDSMIGDLIQAGENPTIGLLASPDMVRIRIAAKADSVEAAEALIAPVEQRIRERIPEGIPEAGDAPLETLVDQLFQARNWTFSTAETVTGGLIAQRLTAAQATAFKGGRVWTGVEAGEEAENKALDMAEKIMVECKTSCGLAMVPDYNGQRIILAMATPDARQIWELGYYGAGARNQLRAAMASLEHVRRFLNRPHRLTN